VPAISSVRCSSSWRRTSKANSWLAIWGPRSVASSTNYVFGHLVSLSERHFRRHWRDRAGFSAPIFSSFPIRPLIIFCLSFAFLLPFFGVLCHFFVINKKRTVRFRFISISQWKKHGEVVGRICECSYIHSCNFALRTQLNIPLTNPAQGTRLLPAPPAKGRFPVMEGETTLPKCSATEQVRLGASSASVARPCINT
jgi:hypothetical protein